MERGEPGWFCFVYVDDIDLQRQALKDAITESSPHERMAKVDLDLMSKPWLDY